METDISKSVLHVIAKCYFNNKGTRICGLNIRWSFFSNGLNSGTSLWSGLVWHSLLLRSLLVCLLTGCWNNRDSLMSCETGVCIPSKYNTFYKKSDNSYFCCCRGDMCNNNISREVIYITKNTTGPNGPSKWLLIKSLNTVYVSLSHNFWLHGLMNLWHKISMNNM